MIYAIFAHSNAQQPNMANKTLDVYFPIFRFPLLERYLSGILF
jgi:hypothetical protein